MLRLHVGARNHTTYLVIRSFPLSIRRKSRAFNIYSPKLSDIFVAPTCHWRYASNKTINRKTRSTIRAVQDSIRIARKDGNE
jgi:hypothetical protein